MSEEITLLDLQLPLKMASCDSNLTCLSIRSKTSLGIEAEGKVPRGIQEVNQIFLCFSI